MNIMANANAIPDIHNNIIAHCSRSVDHNHVDYLAFVAETSTNAIPHFHNLTSALA